MTDIVQVLITVFLSLVLTILILFLCFVVAAMLKGMWSAIVGKK